MGPGKDKVESKKKKKKKKKKKDKRKKNIIDISPFYTTRSQKRIQLSK
jgi:hypothetical protein